MQWRNGWAIEVEILVRRFQPIDLLGRFWYPPTPTRQRDRQEVAEMVPIDEGCASRLDSPLDYSSEVGQEGAEGLEETG